MKWPLGKKFDLWVDAAPSDILEPLQDSSKPWDYIIPPEAGVSGNIIALPGFGMSARFARQIWGTFTQHEHGLRVRGRYGCSLVGLNIWLVIALFATLIISMTIFGDDAPSRADWLEILAFIVAPIIYDRITRPFAKTRYDDFVGYLTRVSRDGAVHSMKDCEQDGN